VCNNMAAQMIGTSPATADRMEASTSVDVCMVNPAAALRNPKAWSAVY